jgi:Mlc titration factor MtfA (ptsG expression regulator)
MFIFLIFIGFVVLATIAFSKLKRQSVSRFPEHWMPILKEHVLFYRKLSLEEQAVFQKRMMAFLSEVHIDGVSIEIEDLDKILIAASAVIPVFGFKEWYYNNLSGIILYPDTFNEDLEFSNTDKKRRILGMIGTGRYEKQMILSRKAIRQAFLNDTDKHNTPVHEFVHLVDKMDGNTDGIPEHILGKDYIKPWQELMYNEMDAINNDQSDIRNYALTNEAEFFAVTSEYFFERPKLFKRKHPELYHILQQCFQQNPAKRE